MGSLSGLLTGRALRATQGMEWLPGEPALAGPAPPFSHCLEFRLQVSGLPFGGGGGPRACLCSVGLDGFCTMLWGISDEPHGSC